MDPTNFARDLKTIKNTLLFFLAITLAVLLKLLSSLFIPLILALFIAMLLYPTLNWFHVRKVPMLLSLTFILVLSVFMLNSVGNVIFQTASEIIDQQEVLGQQIMAKLTPLIELIKRYGGVDMSDYMGSFSETFAKFISIEKILESSGTFAGYVQSIGTMLFMTVLYLVVILSGIMHYESYLDYLEQNREDHRGKLTEAFDQIKNSITTYIKVKFFISLATGISYWLICKIFGVQFALFWGFLAFLLNFIPTFGSILATLPPLILGWIQIPGAGLLIAFAILLVGIQVVLGNVVDPMLMGSSLSINTVVVLIGLVMWTYLLGIVGTILSVPLLVFIKVVLQQMPDAQFLVRMMGKAQPEDLEKLYEDPQSA